MANLKSSKSVKLLKQRIIPQKIECDDTDVNIEELLPMNKKAERIATKVIRNMDKNQRS